ncbi:hypothetical protein GXW82_44230 [Streptacidiphilus sp. 4-A2]|nr:hypothetical protein [Streptacidiphilus sp. 4-A2]
MLTSSDARSASGTDTTYTTTYSYNTVGQPTTARQPSGRTEGDQYTMGTETAAAGLSQPVCWPSAATGVTTGRRRTATTATATWPRRSPHQG